MIFGYFILFISVMISAIAAWYSVVGLTAIFAAAVVPVMIMGGALEAGKIVATVWLHNNWKRVGYAFKLYLIPAIIFLMLLTSMGIFGFLSKAHGDQSLVSGDAMARVAIYDEKIQISKDNIEANRRALKQMDEAVDQVMGRSTDEKGADKAVQIRRSQQKERARLQAEIQAEQKTITAIGAEAAPLRAEFRKIEAEVGPIKYIAALIYGDDASQNMLEAAVRWVIILIVVVFDPLALTLILAANKQLEWARRGKGGWIHDEEDRPVEEKPAVVIPAVEDAEPTVEKVTTEATPTVPVEEPEPIEHPLTEEQREAEEMQAVENFFWRGRMIAKALDAEEEERLAREANAQLAEIEPEEPVVEIPAPEPVPVDPELLESTAKVIEDLSKELQAKEAELEYFKTHTSGVEGSRNEEQAKALALTAQLEELALALTALEQENTRLRSSQDLVLDLRATADVDPNGSASFGTEFPVSPVKGDMFLRVDYLPSKLYKFNGVKWIESDKDLTDQFAYEESYIQHLVQKINSGEYDADDLNDVERERIKEYLDRK
jgi:hypothetical protein